MHHSHGSGFFGGLVHAIVLVFILGGAFIIGCIQSFMAHPLSWIEDFWFPGLLILVGIVGCFMDKTGPRRH